MCVARYDLEQRIFDSIVYWCRTRLFQTGLQTWLRIW